MPTATNPSVRSSESARYRERIAAEDHADPGGEKTRPKTMLRVRVLRRFIKDAPTIDPMTPPTPNEDSKTRYSPRQTGQR